MFLRFLICSVLALFVPGLTYALSNNQFLAKANSNSYYLGSDLVFVYSENTENAYIQNYKTLQILKSASIPELTKAYRFNFDRVLLPGEFLVLNRGQRLNMNTFEVSNYPFEISLSQVSKYKNNNYIAVSGSEYCVFKLEEGCPQAKVLKFKKPIPEISSSDLYSVSETSDSLVFLSTSSKELILASLNKNTLEWKVLHKGLIPYDTPISATLGTKTNGQTLFLAFLAERNDAGQKNSFIATWDLKSGKLNFKELADYFDTFDLVNWNGKEVELMGKTLTGCFGLCPYHQAKNIRIDTQSLAVSDGFKPRFELALGKPVYTYKNTAENSEFVQLSANQFVKFGSGFTQTRNYNEFYQPGLGFQLVDGQANFNDVCHRSQSMAIFVNANFNRRFCQDVDQQELSVFKYLSRQNFQSESELAPGDFRGFTGVKRFDLSGTGIEVLQAGQFEGLTALEYLNVSYGSLGRINNGAFRGLSNLSELVIGGSAGLKVSRELVIEDGSFAGLNSLESITLTGLEVKASKNVFAGLPTLAYLSFYGADLRSAASDFLSLVKVKALSFNGGAKFLLTADSLAGQTELEDFRMWNLNLTSLPDGSFKDLKALKSLSLRYNQITTISDANLADLKNLTVLELYENPISKDELDRIKLQLPNTEVRF